MAYLENPVLRDIDKEMVENMVDHLLDAEGEKKSPRTVKNYVALLSSVFNLSAPTKGISKKSVLSLQEDPRVSWLIPISLGDTHKGFRVIGTTNAYFQHFKYGDKQPLSFASGGLFSDAGSTVIGADIAESLGYSVADNIVISHGLGNVSFRQHDAYPFTVVGV